MAGGQTGPVQNGLGQSGFGMHSLTRRAELVRQPRPEGVGGPKLHLLLAELKAFAPRRDFAFLLNRVANLARTEGVPVALVGWSLGGLFAREIAKNRPDAVSRVITMGTPFSGDRRNNNAWRAYELVTGHGVDQPPVPGDFAVKPPVPTIALWSPRDGIVSPRSACGWPGERDRAVAVRCNHLGFANDPRVIAEVLRQLDAEF
jgi:pimeloyl-ACP methyl ester carboxylesterase